MAAVPDRHGVRRRRRLVGQVHPDRLDAVVAGGGGLDVEPALGTDAHDRVVQPAEEQLLLGTHVVRGAADAILLRLGKRLLDSPLGFIERTGLGDTLSQLALPAAGVRVVKDGASFTGYGFAYDAATARRAGCPTCLATMRDWSRTTSWLRTT